jgi:hypothetical protein
MEDKPYDLSQQMKTHMIKADMIKAVNKLAMYFNIIKATSNELTVRSWKCFLYDLEQTTMSTFTALIPT